MAKKRSKTSRGSKTSEKKTVKNSEKPKASKKRSVKVFFQNLKKKLQPDYKRSNIFRHKSFRRSYREDYQRDLEVPGMMYHIMATFKIIFKNWKLFLPLMLIAVVLSIVLVGLMSEDTYRQFQTVLDQTSAQMGSGDIGNVARAGLLLISTVTTGGLSGASNEVTITFSVLIFLMVWLTTVFLLRHRLAGHQVKLRDGLYNGMTPLISTLVVFLIAVLQCVPIFILIIAYSAAVRTEFLTTPFYALVFFIFAALLILLSSYWLSSTLIALVAVTAPGMYPMPAMKASSELMSGRRVRFILRIISLIVVVVIMWVIVMMPLILFDLWMKQFEWTAYVPFVSICLVVMTCFTEIYVSAYLYLYYRYLLDA
ncbi:hypothetical protein IJ101_02575 [Candidatus Saccharibacteria bacterium]|nr:hypothetical protein [Candidatus Saccharibacteria bacterium]